MRGGIVERANQPVKTFALLDQISAILGTTNTSFWLMSALAGTPSATTSIQIVPYGTGVSINYLLAANLAGTTLAMTNIMSMSCNDLACVQFVDGIHLVAADKDAAATDFAAHSFGDGTVDSPFSVGIWVQMNEAVGTARTLLAKYNAAGFVREWKFSFSATGKLIMELYDEDVDTTEIATSTGTALTPGIWQFCVMTYDGGETAPVINLYINATSVHDGTSAESGAYVAMENGATPLMIGADGVNATPVNGLNGRIFLPFICGKALTAAEVSALYYYGQRLIGLA